MPAPASPVATKAEFTPIVALPMSPIPAASPATGTHNAGASITGDTAGILTQDGFANVTNSGSITASTGTGTGYAIYAFTNATVTNNVGASITAHGYGIYTETGFANVN